MMLNVVIPNWRSGSAVAQVSLRSHFSSPVHHWSIDWSIELVLEKPTDKRRKEIRHLDPDRFRTSHGDAFFRELLGDELYNHVLLEAWRQICPVPDKMKEGAQDG